MSQVATNSAALNLRRNFYELPGRLPDEEKNARLRGKHESCHTGYGCGAVDIRSLTRQRKEEWFDYISASFLTVLSDEILHCTFPTIDIRR